MSIGNADQKAFWETFATLWVGKQEDLDALPPLPCGLTY